MRMGAVETVTALSAALNAHDLDRAGRYLTDDFTFSGPTPQPQNKQEFLAAQKAWFAGVPDWSVALSNMSDAGGRVTATAQISGTQTNTLALPGQPALPATGKHFSSRDGVTATLRGDQVAALVLQPGAPGILEQLGVQIPPR
jgi:hypothetical protein